MTHNNLINPTGNIAGRFPARFPARRVISAFAIRKEMIMSRYWSTERRRLATEGSLSLALPILRAAGNVSKPRAIDILQGQADVQR
jgi:hypothetical protein